MSEKEEEKESQSKKENELEEEKTQEVAEEKKEKESEKEKEKQSDKKEEQEPEPKEETTKEKTYEPTTTQKINIPTTVIEKTEALTKLPSDKSSNSTQLTRLKLESINQEVADSSGILTFGISIIGVVPDLNKFTLPLSNPE